MISCILCSKIWFELHCERGHWFESIALINSIWGDRDGFSLRIVELGPEYLRVFYCVQQGADFQWINTHFCWIRPNEE